MIERNHLRIIRAVQRVVAAAKELTEAERALRQPRRHARHKAADRRATTDTSGLDHMAKPPSGRPADVDAARSTGGA